MPAPRKYPQELRERAMRLVHEARQEDPELSVNAAVHRIGTRVGVNPDTFAWLGQAGRYRRREACGDDHGRRPQDQGPGAGEP